MISLRDRGAGLAAAGADPSFHPLFGIAHELPGGFADPIHKHDEGQLLYAAAGTMSVTADRMSLVLPPNRAIWLPAGTRHEMECRNPMTLCAVHVDQRWSELSGGCCVLEVTDFLRALILEVVRARRWGQAGGHSPHAAGYGACALSCAHASFARPIQAVPDDAEGSRQSARH